VRGSPLNLADLYKLAFSVGGHATRTDLLRGWRELASGPMPAGRNPVERRQLRNYLERIWPARPGHNAYFHAFAISSPSVARPSHVQHHWRAVGFHKSHYARRWAQMSRATISDADSRALLEDTLGQIHSGQGEWLKHGGSGDVWKGTVIVAGRPLVVVAKIPRRKYWYRHLTDLLQGDRSARAWTRSWQMATRGIPVAWPLLRAATRVGPFVREGLVISAWVDGDNLAGISLGDLEFGSRQTLFFRLGRSIRQIEQAGFCHFDTKTSNWIIQHDPQLGPVPVIVDIDGIRPYRWNGEGMRRLRSSLAEHREFTPADLAALELGYNPWAKGGAGR
jgi:tRNA A-37 threonylcarbamoyl transferase component Bud32